MHRAHGIATVAAAAILALVFSPAGTPAKKVPEAGPAVLWREPGDIASKNLFYGPGGKAHEPKAPFRFEKEDMNGTNPKFEIIDQDGVTWVVKMGDEAGPETVASRLVWAAGYFAHENYFLPVLQVQGMKRLSRGQPLVSGDGTVKNVRLKRHSKGEEKIGYWQWRDNPFKGTREWYGLQVMMALINNWDLKDINNAIYQVGGDHPEQRYMVSDLGSSFGPTGLGLGLKNDPKEYVRSKWIGRTTASKVNFNIPAGPAWYRLFNFTEARRFTYCWIARDIPTADARWIGMLLAQLTPEQIHDAFRSAGYPAAQVDALSAELQRRINALAAM